LINKYQRTNLEKSAPATMHVSFTESNINGTRLDRPIIVLHANISLFNNNICVMVLPGDKQKTEYKHISWEK